jgi:hypothetical protein
MQCRIVWSDGCLSERVMLAVHQTAVRDETRRAENNLKTIYDINHVLSATWSAENVAWYRCSIHSAKRASIGLQVIVTKRPINALISDLRNAFWPWTLCFILMHLGKTFPSFSTHKYGIYAKRKKVSPECNLPLERTVSSGYENSHVCVITLVTKSVHCLCFIASLGSPLLSKVSSPGSF